MASYSPIFIFIFS